MVPPFASGTAARPEGIAQVAPNIPDCPDGTRPTGNPPDDDFGPGGSLYRRSPSTRLELIDPNGNIFRNDNPSGNREWDQFTVATNGCTVGVDADYCVGSLTPGTWRVRLIGMDAGNVNAFFFPFRLVTANRRVRVQKITGTAVHPAQTFSRDHCPRRAGHNLQPLADGQRRRVGAPGSPGGASAQLITETPVPSGWTLIGYTLKPDPNGLAICDPSEPYTGTDITVPANAANYLVCIRNDFTEVQERVVKVRKVTATPTHPQQAFAGIVVPGGPATTFNVLLGQDQTQSPIQQLTLGTVAHALVEVPVPASWTLVGYHVRPTNPQHDDDDIEAACDPQAAYGPAAVIPADTGSYLVCIRNDFRPVTERRVRIQKVTGTPTHPTQIFGGPIVPGGPTPAPGRFFWLKIRPIPTSPSARSPPLPRPSRSSARRATGR